VFDLPLFPLSTVLFPGAPLNLHIFEPRYIEMIDRCLQEKSSFGVVLIRQGREALGPLATPFAVGCSAQIIHADPLGDGRMDIATVGVERFRIHTLDHDRPYLVGKVERLPLPDEAGTGLDRAALTLRKRVLAYLTLISDQLPDSVDSKFLPPKPIALAYIAAYILQAPAADKQSLLEASSVDELITRLDRLYRREIPLVNEIRRRAAPTERGFTLN